MELGRIQGYGASLVARRRVRPDEEHGIFESAGLHAEVKTGSHGNEDGLSADSLQPREPPRYGPPPLSASFSFHTGC